MNICEMVKRLADMDAVSGREAESEMAAFITGELGLPEESARYDRLGNLTVSLARNKGKHIMLEAHADEAAFIVTGITDRGFIRVAPTGGTYMGGVLGNVFTVLGRGKYPAVPAVIPPHLASKDTEGMPEAEDILLDAGMSAELAKKLISPGDPVVRRERACSLSGDRITGKALDNRAGVAALIWAAKRILDRGTDNSVTLAFACQEEIGTRGAGTAARIVCPDEALCVDVSFAVQPGVGAETAGRLGAGPMIGVSPVLSRNISGKLRMICEREGIPFQTEVMAGRTGTDADAIQISEKGIPCGLVSIPLRNMHSSAEVIDVNDVESTAELAALYCGER